MKWKPDIEEKKLVVINVTGLAAYNEQQCQFCGRYGCVDRGFTLTAGDPPATISEAQWAPQVQDKLAGIIEKNKEIINIQYTNVAEPQCNRKLKKANALAVIERIKACGDDCHRNLDCTEGGVWKKREDDYVCPFRDEYNLCLVNSALDGGRLECQPDKEGQVECSFHEDAYRFCFRRKEGKPCYDINDKYSATNQKNDKLLVLAHRFSASPCQYCIDNLCTNTESQHNEGVCIVNGLMTTCAQYQAITSDHAYTEGVCTYVSSADGKDDRKIFPSSNYARGLKPEQRDTLCLACRISHSIAKATGQKCLGVRRSSKNPFLNDTNPLADKAIQINYLYLTHPEDVAKYNPDLIAQAIYDAMTKDCVGLECEEYQSCNFNPM